MSAAATAMTPEGFVERLRGEGARRYHDQHPFHVAMHAGTLTRQDLARWVANRYYYQTRIPIKDALIISKSDDRLFRRAWIRRIHDHDGEAAREAHHEAHHEAHPVAGEGGRDSEAGARRAGGLVEWQRLGEAVGLAADDVASFRHVLPGVRFACDAYVSLVRDSSLVVAVASSLTEFFAPDLMSRRIAAWEAHYPFVDPAGLAYFRGRVTRARRDSEEAIAFVLARATTLELQEACVAALIRKTEILWHLLDCVAASHVALPLSPPRDEERTRAP